MPRQPRPYRRCQVCSKRVERGLRRCAACGSDRITWAYRMDVNAPGEPRRPVHRSGLTQEQALAEIREHLQRIDRGRPEPTRLTVGQWLEEWLQSIRGREQVRPGTWAGYELNVRLHLTAALGVVPLRQLRTAQIEGAYGRFSDEGLSPKTVHNIHLVLRSALEAAVRNELIESNPAARAHGMSATRGEMKTWSADQAGRFLRAVAGDPLAAFWRLALMTGMRRGELLGLRWRDVDLDGAFLSVQQQLTRQGDRGLVLAEPKTSRGRRRIPLDAATVAALRARRSQQEIVPVQDLVFTRADGHALDPDTVTDAFRKATRAAGLPLIRLHDLRHTAATLMLRAGIHPKVVQERLGHASITMTLDLYSHAVPAMSVEAADQLAALVDGGAS